MVMHEVKVLVPEDRLADFYARFGAWLAGSDVAFASEFNSKRRGLIPESRNTSADTHGGKHADSRRNTHANSRHESRADSGRESDTDSGIGRGTDLSTSGRATGVVAENEAVHPRGAVHTRGMNERAPKGAATPEQAPQDRTARSDAARRLDEAQQASDRTGSHDEDLLDGAVEWWRSLKRNERDIFTLFMDAAPHTLGATEIVGRLGLKSERVIPGVLAWPRRKAARAGFPLAWKFEHDPDGKARYGLRNMPEVSMSAIEYASLLREAKRTVEG